MNLAKPQGDQGFIYGQKVLPKSGALYAQIYVSDGYGRISPKEGRDLSDCQCTYQCHGGFESTAEDGSKVSFSTIHVTFPDGKTRYANVKTADMVAAPDPKDNDPLSKG